MPNRLLIKQFLRSGIAIAGISLLLLSGIISLFIGKSYLEKQRDKIEATAVYQQQHIDRNVQYGHSEMGLLLYYLRFAYVNSINPLNGLSIGQRDVNLGIQQVTIRNLIEKKYDSDLNNPASMVMGNLDFSFVLIYLFPLLIITFTYNLLSEEKEEGTWRLINIQSNAAKKVLLQKWWIRSAFVTGTLLLLYLLAIPILSIPINASYLAMIAEGVLYILFWFIACAMVVGWQKNSATNAVSLLSIWLLLTIVAPAVINSLITTKYPVPEAMATVVANREGYHDKWDRPKEETMGRFYAHYPQFQQYRLPAEDFNWLWYYAMQQMGDDDAAEHSVAMRNKLLLREKLSNTVGYFIPTLHTQLQYSLLAQSGLKNQVQFLDSTTAFHEKKRLYFYPKIFKKLPVLQEDWRKHYAVEYFKSEPPVNWIKLLLPLLLIIILFTTINFIQFKNLK